MMAVSAMITSFVKLSIPLTFSFGGAEIAPQAILDSLVPSMLPLLLVMVSTESWSRIKRACICASS